MTDIISITSPAVGASGNSTPACPIFGAAVQGLERLLQADAAAQHLPDGDPAYYNGSTDADAAFDAALDAAEHASYRASQRIYQGASNMLIYALSASSGHDVRMALLGFENLLRDESDRFDKTVQLSLTRTFAVLEDLAAVWEGREIEEALMAQDVPSDPQDRDPFAMSLDDWEEAFDENMATEA